MIYVGIDDTDMPDAPGTNQLAKALAVQLAGQCGCALIVRHQLLLDPRVPCTSKNSAASMLLTPRNGLPLDALIDQLRDILRRRSAHGSDPGLSVAVTVSAAVSAFAKRCQQELVTQRDARRVARRHDVHLEGLAGTEDGVIGALAAVGLLAEGNDGRVVQIGTWPDDLAGPQDVNTLRARGVEVRCLETGMPVGDGTVDVGKRLRPNYRQKRIVLFARRAADAPEASSCWHAVRLT